MNDDVIQLDDDAPLYRQVVRDLRAEIESGAFAVGTRLPTEDALCRRFAVSRHTIREALRTLREEGLVASRQGAGTTVIGTRPNPLYVHAVASVDELLQYAAETRYEAEAGDIVTADDALAARLRCPVGTRWQRFDGYRYRAPDAPPICWTEVFVHADYARVAEMVGKRAGPIYSWIEATYGERVTEIEQTLRATTIPAAIARRLAAEPGSMAIEISRAYRTAAGKLAEVSFNLHPADRFSYSITLRRDQRAA